MEPWMLRPRQQHFLDQLPSEGARVVRIVASADLHPERISERLLPVNEANSHPASERLKLQTNP
jgi:hypothetical protein